LPYSCKSESWYYADNSFKFFVPDKAQHFYGSYYLCQTTSTEFAVASGVAYEFYQSQSGQFFSIKDMVANVLGCIAYNVNDNKVCLYVTANNTEKIITLNMKVRW
jgi:hypothetical protein